MVRNLPKPPLYRTDLLRKVVVVIAILPFVLPQLAFAQTDLAEPDTEIRFPYQALVRSAKTVVRSGPGKVHYGTEALKQGDSVLVYRHDPGNWAAIRPLDRSFSLVPESTLKMVEDGIGEVIIEDARAWVGTHLGPVENPQWQVKLRKGELINVIGEVFYPDPDGHSQAWYQIEPPAGEFRWVRLDALKPLVAQSPTRPVIKDDAVQTANHTHTSSPNSFDSPTQRPPRDLNTRDDRVIGSGLKRVPKVMPRPQASLANRNPPFSANERVESPVQPIESFAGPEPDIALTNATSEIPSPQNQEGINEGWRPSTRPISKRSFSNQSQTPTNDWQTPTGSSQPSSWSAEARNETNANAIVRTADRAPSMRSFASNLRLAEGSVRTSYTNMSSELAAIEDRLTIEMSKDPRQWQLNDLAVEAKRLVRSANSGGELENANRLITKIQNCELLKAQFLGNPSAGLPLGSRNQTQNILLQNPSIPGASTAPGNPANLAAVASSSPAISSPANRAQGYDAIGWLNELKRGQGAARSTYVLLNDQGRITHHIQPVPGVNLTRYLKRKIGVVGKLGFHQDLNLKHVLASRVYEVAATPSTN